MSEEGNREGGAWRWEPLMALWVGESERHSRDCWLVAPEAAPGVRELLEELAGQMTRGHAGSFELLDMDNGEMSDEALRACERAGDKSVMFAFEGPESEDAGALRPLLEELAALARAGLALGPSRLESREDGRIFELDAALACLAMRESWAMSADATARQRADSVKAPAPRL